MVNIEQLQKKVDGIKTDLDTLKKEADESVKKTKTETISDTAKNLKEEIDSALAELKKDVHKNKHEIETLEDMKKSLEGFDKEVNDLKSQIEKEKSKEVKSAPSLRASIFYGGLIAKGLGSLPFIGDSIKSWAEAKVKESAEEKEKEKKEPKEKKSRWGKILTWTGIGVGGYLAWKNWDKVKGWFSGLFESKKKKEEETEKLEAEKQGLSAKKKAETEEAPVVEPENNEDSFGNEIVYVDNDSQIPREQRDEKTVYYITYPSGNIKYKIFGNGRYAEYADIAEAHGTMGNWSVDQNNNIVFAASIVAPEAISDAEVHEKIDITNDTEANHEAQQMAQEGYSDLFILVRMYELGFVPKVNFEKRKGASLRGKTKYVLEGGPFTKNLDKLGGIRGNFKNRLLANIKLSRDQITKMKLEAIKKSAPNVQGMYDAEIKNYDIEGNKLLDMHNDIEKGKITKFQEFKAKFGLWNKERAKRNINTEYNKMAEKQLKLEKVRAEVKKIDEEMKKIKSEAASKLKSLDYQAKKEQKNPKKLKELRAQAETLKTQYNTQILELEKQTGIKLSTLDATEITRIAQGSPTVSKLMKLNNGVDKYLAGKKIGKIMIGAAVINLVREGGAGMTGETLQQVGLEALDLGAGMVPFAGGVYDITSAFTGKCAAGELGMTDRVIRGSVGAVSLVLDVAGLFTFGAGNAASAGVKALSRAGITAAKTVKVVKVARTVSEVGSTAMKLGTYGFLGYSLYEGIAKPVAVSIYEEVDKAQEEDVIVTT